MQYLCVGDWVGLGLVKVRVRHLVVMVWFRVSAWVIHYVCEKIEMSCVVCVRMRTHVCLQTEETRLFSTLAPLVALPTCNGSGGHMTHSLTLYRAL